MIKDEKKTKRQLIEELSVFRQQVGQLDFDEERRLKFDELIRTFVESSPVPVVVSDRDQKTLYLSRKFEETFGYDRQEIATLNDWWRVSYSDRSGGDKVINSWQNNIAKAIQNGRQIDSIETYVICKDGAKRYVEFKFVNVGDQYMMFCHDLTDAKRTEKELARANEKLKVWVCELEMQNSRMNLLRRMGEALHTCRNVEDASPIIKQYGPQLFPKTNGSLYTLDESCEKMRSVVKWGNYSNEDIMLAPGDCEALRVGKPLEKKGKTEGGQKTTLNSCICDSDNWIGICSAMCIPMKAVGQVQGILHLGFYNEDEAYERGVKELALVVAEHLALSLANLKMQDTLRAQAIRDPLTGLFNRRYMEECLEREFHRAARKRHPVSIIMVDIDFFKLFNDAYGHDAGDDLLKILSDIFQNNVRKEDIVCRFGGEEFVLIMPDMPLNVATQRANQLRDELKNYNFHYQGVDLGAVTISLGVAAFPGHGNDAPTVLKKADDALYKAKNNGRNRVEVAVIK
ncbi:MAG: diguanylate cyclase [Deltaproteobacteria bacterium]|nr:diguanylate cyclase [Deltaproteobacteria bacterium]